MRRFVLGDIHGEYEYLVDVLKKSGFDYENDLLIQIGDIVDRGLEPFLCMDELLKVKHLILIKGNHDEGFYQSIIGKKNILSVGFSNGVQITNDRWRQLTDEQRAYYKKEIFDKQVYYYHSDDNIIFVHGGLDPYEKLTDTPDHIFTWDRELIGEVVNHPEKPKIQTVYDFKEIYVGHTPTIYWGVLKPISSRGVINIDTGSGKGGPLTILNIDTKEYWQSDHKINLKDYGFKEEDQSSEIPCLQEKKN